VTPAARVALPLCVVAAVFLAFIPALGADWVNYDDPVNFQNNPHYRGLGPAQLGWMFTDIAGHYIPLTWMTLGLDYLLWGMNPAGYHFTSVALHAVNAVLAYFFLLLLVPRFRLENVPAAWLHGAAAAGALVFAIHPLRVESVAWVTERRDVVAGLFFMASLIAYLRAVPPEPGGRADRRWLAVSAALFACSLLGKTIGMTLPLALLTLDAYPLGRLGRHTWKRALLEKIPFLLLMAAGVAITAVAQKEAGSMSAASHTLSQMVPRPTHRLAFYFLKTLLPFNLSPLYPEHPPEAFFQAKFVLSFLAVAAITALLLRYRRSHPGLLAAWIGFAALLGPVIGPFQAGPHFAADRYTYLAALPFSVAAAVFLLKRRRARDGRGLRRGPRGPGRPHGAAVPALDELRGAVVAGARAGPFFGSRVQPEGFGALRRGEHRRNPRGPERGAAHPSRVPGGPRQPGPGAAHERRRRRRAGGRRRGAEAGPPPREGLRGARHHPPRPRRSRGSDRGLFESH
jgi:protein O-mannosyl-transferase